MQKNSSSLQSDTIAAQATASGRGGIAIVRVSGPLVAHISKEILGKEIYPREVNYLSFLDSFSQTIDEGLAIFFRAPHSFTGEDVLELHGHGGPIVVDMLLERILSLGARLARPGEFSERAFLNNKIDLTQAEAIADLIDASSQQAARLALRSLQGEFAKKITGINEKLIQLRMYIESAIDFAEEEIDFLHVDVLHKKFTSLLQDLEQIQMEAQQGSFLREGITAVIAGKPNVGKSSLLNSLSGKDAAIVTDIAGTTRDVLREQILIDNIPMHIIDTAGLRTSNDLVEQEGIRRAYAEIEKADIILYVVEAKKEFILPELSEIITSRPVIFICNKIDLIDDLPRIEKTQDKTIIFLSAKSGQGIDILKKQIKMQIGFKDDCQGIFLARRRHLDSLKHACTHLKSAFQQLELATELVAEELRLAQRALSEITGEFTTDDLLGEIFANFCIGK